MRSSEVATDAFGEGIDLSQDKLTNLFGLRKATLEDCGTSVPLTTCILFAELRAALASSSVTRFLLRLVYCRGVSLLSLCVQRPV